MMKTVFWLSLLLILIFTFAGCIPADETPQPTQVSALPSITIPPATATPLPTSKLTPTITDTVPSPTRSPTSSPTPIDTLEPEIASATLEPLISDPLNCSVPCFWGIIPGETDFDEARTFFSRLGFTLLDGPEENIGSDYLNIRYETSIGHDTSVTIYPLYNNKVSKIRIQPSITKLDEGSPRWWIAYSPETLIKKFGAPSRVEWALDWGPNFVITMIMYFDNLDLIAEYSGYNMIMDRPRSPRVCPLTVPFDFVRLWMGERPLDPIGFNTVPLEEATSLTIEQFTQLMMGDPQQACFIVNGDVFE